MNWVLLWYAAAGVATFVAFGVDKRRAVRGWRRIPEATLQTMALLGGFAGALAGRAVFRHKISKRQFSGQLYAITLLHGLAWLVAWTM